MRLQGEIQCRWSIEHYKACLVIRGDKQIEGFDCIETFALVAKMTSVWCFLVVAITRGWELHQMDVNNVFLHNNLNEEVYMTMRPGFKAPNSSKVCKLQKSLHGLK